MVASGPSRARAWASRAADAPGRRARQARSLRCAEPQQGQRVGYQGGLRAPATRAARGRKRLRAAFCWRAPAAALPMLLGASLGRRAACAVLNQYRYTG